MTFGDGIVWPVMVVVVVLVAPLPETGIKVHRCLKFPNKVMHRKFIQTNNTRVFIYIQELRKNMLTQLWQIVCFHINFTTLKADPYSFLR